MGKEVQIKIKSMMPDREKVINGLQNLRDAIATDFIHDADHAVGTIDDAIALLKEQEAVKPGWSRGKPFCGACGSRIRGGKFCSECGKPIAWEGR